MWNLFVGITGSQRQRGQMTLRLVGVSGRGTAKLTLGR
jgi:hypothetical protein